MGTVWFQTITLNTHLAWLLHLRTSYETCTETAMLDCFKSRVANNTCATTWPTDKAVTIKVYTLSLYEKWIDV